MIPTSASLICSWRCLTFVIGQRNRQNTPALPVRSLPYCWSVLLTMIQHFDVIRATILLWWCSKFWRDPCYHIVVRVFQILTGSVLLTMINYSPPPCERSERILPDVIAAKAASSLFTIIVHPGVTVLGNWNLRGWYVGPRVIGIFVCFTRSWRPQYWINMTKYENLTKRETLHIQRTWLVKSCGRYSLPQNITLNKSEL